MTTRFIKRLIAGRAVFLVLIAVVSVIIYGNIFDNAFIFDDLGHIRDGNIIRNFFKEFEWDLLLVPRNVVNLTFALNYQFSNLDVFSYHLVNLIIHILNGFVVFFLSSLMLRRLFELSPGPTENDGDQTIRLVSFFAALIFVVHPLQTQAVTYTIQRYTSMAALFYLASLLFYLKARTAQCPGREEEKNPRDGKGESGFSHKAGRQVPGEEKKGSAMQKKKVRIPSPDGPVSLAERSFPIQVTVFLYYGLFIFSAVLALLSKQNAVSLPMAVLAVEYFFVDRTPKEWIRKLPWIVISFSLWTAFVFLVIGGFASFSGEGLLEVLSQKSMETELVDRWTYLFTQFNVLVTYLRLLVLPVNQSIDYIYPFHRAFFSGYTPVAFLFLMSLIGAAIGLRKKMPLFSFGIFWFFITLSVESSIIPIRDALFEHRLYLPMFGFSLALSDGVFTVFGRKKTWAVAALVILVVSLSVAAHLRNEVWRDGVTLWSDAVRKNPRNVRAYNNLANALLQEGRVDEAEKTLKSAFEIQPGYDLGMTILGLIYMKKEMPDRAKETFLAVLEKNPFVVGARMGLGEVLEKEGRKAEAAEQYEEVLRMEPGHLRAKVRLAGIMSSLGRGREGEEYLAEIMDRDPGDPAVLVGLGNLKRLGGDSEGALCYYARAVESDPRSVEALLNMASIMAERKRYEDAEMYLKEVICLDPGHGKARNDLGGILIMRENFPEARRELEAALQADPENDAALFNLARLSELEGNPQKAVQYYEMYLEKKPGDWEASQSLGGVFLSLGDVDNARKWIETSLRLNPANALLHNRLAILLVRKGDFGEARKHYDRALEIDGNLKPVVYYNLACLDSLRGRGESSLRWLERAFQSGYGKCGNALTDADLENLRKHPGFSDVLAKYCRGKS